MKDVNYKLEYEAYTLDDMLEEARDKGLLHPLHRAQRAGAVRKPVLAKRGMSRFVPSDHPLTDYEDADSSEAYNDEDDEEDDGSNRSSFFSIL